MTDDPQQAARARTARVLPGLTLVLPVSMVLLVAAAPAASAAISGVDRGEVVRDDDKLSIVADYGPTIRDDPPRLTLTEPGRDAVVVAAEVDVVRAGQLSYTFDPQCWVPETPSGSCTTPQPARNGSWTLVQTGGASTDALTFQLVIAPKAPTAVTAVATSPRDMRVSWRRGAEPDLTSFTVFEGDESVQVDVPAGDVCDDAGACGTVVSYPGESTPEHTYTVRAARSDGTDGFLVSPRSSSASGSFLGPIAPPGPAGPGTGPGSGAGTDGASPTPGASGSPSTAGSAGGSGSGSDQAAARRREFSEGFAAFDPKLGIPKLPPLPKPPPPADGTFEPTLGFDDQVLREEAEPGGVTRAVGYVFDSERWARSAAGALILLLVSAHLRRWLGESPQD